MVEQSLVFIKPDGVKKNLVGDIIRRFEKRGMTLRGLEMLELSEKLVDKHYEEHIDKPFYPNLKQYVMSGPVVVMVLEGENVIAAIRKMVGATDSAEAAPGTIRGDFALTKQENVIHASDSPESAEREIKNFFGSCCDDEGCC